MNECVVAYVPSTMFSSPHDFQIEEMNGAPLRVVRVDAVVTATQEYLLAKVTPLRHECDAVVPVSAPSELLAIPMKDVYMVLKQASDCCELALLIALWSSDSDTLFVCRTTFP